MGSPRNPDPAHDTDAQLAEGCRRGNVSAYEQLYIVHGLKMKSVALNMLGSVQDAEDAVQEAFIKIYRSAAAFKGDCAFTTWIYRILVNACYDQLRRRRRRSAETSGEIADSAKGAPRAAGVQDHPLRITLERSLRQLAHRSRAVFLLFEVEGFKHREIAEILEIPEGTSKNILFEARRELQRLLSADRNSRRL